MPLTQFSLHVTPSMPFVVRPSTSSLHVSIISPSVVHIYFIHMLYVNVSLWSACLPYLQCNFSATLHVLAMWPYSRRYHRLHLHAPYSCICFSNAFVSFAGFKRRKKNHNSSPPLPRPRSFPRIVLKSRNLKGRLGLVAMI